jgi:hypothetical protein
VGTINTAVNAALRFHFVGTTRRRFTDNTAAREGAVSR